MCNSCKGYNDFNVLVIVLKVCIFSFGEFEWLNNSIKTSFLRYVNIAERLESLPLSYELLSGEAPSFVHYFDTSYSVLHIYTSNT